MAEELRKYRKMLANLSVEDPNEESLLQNKDEERSEKEGRNIQENKVQRLRSNWLASREPATIAELMKELDAFLKDTRMTLTKHKIYAAGRDLSSNEDWKRFAMLLVNVVGEKLSTASLTLGLFLLTVVLLMFLFLCLAIYLVGRMLKEVLSVARKTYLFFFAVFHFGDESNSREEKERTLTIVRSRENWSKDSGHLADDEVTEASFSYRKSGQYASSESAPQCVRGSKLEEQRSLPPGETDNTKKKLRSSNSLIKATFGMVVLVIAAIAFQAIIKLSFPQAQGSIEQRIRHVIMTLATSSIFESKINAIQEGLARQANK